MTRKANERPAVAVQETASAQRIHDVFDTMTSTGAGMLEAPFALACGNRSYSVAVVPFNEHGLTFEVDHHAERVLIKATADAAELIDRICHAKSELDALAAQKDETEELESLRDELRQLAPFVDAYARQHSQLRMAFWNAGVFDDSPDAFDATLEQLREAKRRFESLPEQVQRDILNGWSVQKDRPTNQELRAAGELNGVRSVLELSFSRNRVHAERTFSCESGTDHSPLCILIQEGTSKADALDLLESGKRLIREAFSELIREVSNISDLATMVHRGYGIKDALAADAENLGRIASAVRKPPIVDANGTLINEGDFVAVCGSVNAGPDRCGRVVQIRDTTVTYENADGSGLGKVPSAECFVISGMKKGGSSPSSDTRKLGGIESGMTNEATTAAA